MAKQRIAWALRRYRDCCTTEKEPGASTRRVLTAQPHETTRRPRLKTMIRKGTRELVVTSSPRLLPGLALPTAGPLGRPPRLAAPEATPREGPACGPPGQSAPLHRLVDWAWWSIPPGRHTWSNLQDQGPHDPPPRFDFGRYLDFLRERNHNFIRLWAWEQARWAPWSDGKGPEPRRLVHPAQPYAPDRAGDGLTAADSTSSRSTSRISTRSASCPAGGRAGDLRLGDALPGLELGQGRLGWHARGAAIPTTPTTMSRASAATRRVTAAPTSTTRSAASDRPLTSAR